MEGIGVQECQNLMAKILQAGMSLVCIVVMASHGTQGLPGINTGFGIGQVGSSGRPLPIFRTSNRAWSIDDLHSLNVLPPF